MRLEELDYELPRERIAQTPAEPRDSARLMVVRRDTGLIEHHRFGDLPHLVAAPDLFVANDSRVMAARLNGRKSTGGAVEVLLLSPKDATTWVALIRGRAPVGSRICFESAPAAATVAEVVAVEPGGARVLSFDQPAEALMKAQGALPLPPYIHTPLADGERYQTVYSAVAGSAAAPTAGLHFTYELIARLAEAGIAFAFVTLHIGADTFVPVKVARVEQHPIHREWCSVSDETVAATSAARAAGGRVVAVGTTSVRALETTGRTGGAYEGPTDLFILPGHRFTSVDALLTNFHLPRTTLLALVAAFTGPQLLREAYAEAIRGPYRFYSFGDAMLVL